MSRIPHPDEAIAAIASAPGGAQRGIVRLSGVDCERILRECGISCAMSISTDTLNPCRSLSDRSDRTAVGLGRKSSVPFAEHIEIAVPGLAVSIPALLFFWRGSRSYTGQPLVEIHAPGSPPLLEAILSRLLAAGARPALPGEFTQRAFLSGRIDLLQAEAIPGVVDARDTFQLKQALEQLGGGVSSLVTRLRGDLLDLVADLEAGLDFADEDIEFVSSAMVASRVGLARDAIQDLLKHAGTRLRSTTEPRVVLAGPPNAGKSTLFNALVGAHAAIVSDVPGTTRDYLSGQVRWNDSMFTLIDTAGCESAEIGIPEEAQSRTRQQIAEADLIVWCQSCDAPTVGPSVPSSESTLHLLTKCDLAQNDPTPSPDRDAVANSLQVSATSGLGLDALKTEIVSRLIDHARAEENFVGTLASRCIDSLAGAAKALDRALTLARETNDNDLLSIELRDALDELGKITGAVYTDDILDRVFSRFCIGK